MVAVIGWDIGGANIKAACVAQEQGGTVRERVVSKPFEIWQGKDRLPDALRAIFSSVAADVSPLAMAATMTAELSDAFATKREGVLFVLQNLKNCFPDVPTYLLSVSGKFVSIDEAPARPLDFAAANWRASAQWLSREFPNCILVDVGSTTTDILPILDGEVRVSGFTDTARLSSGELVFTGALRTNLAAIVQWAPVAGKFCRVASEYFAISGDVHMILGSLQPEDYTCPTPDGRAPSIDSARSRLARLVCADTEMLSIDEIDELARFICNQQILQIREGIERVMSRTPLLRRFPAVVLGSGAFLGAAAAESLGLSIRRLANGEDRGKSEAVPCIAAAYLLAETLKAESK